MRQVVPYVAKNGTTTYRVRFREGSKQRSETFRREKDATTFATLLDNGGLVSARSWLNEHQQREEAITFADWHEAYVEQLTGVTPRTRDDYRAYRRRYLSDLDDLPLPLITRAHVTGLVNRLEREGKKPKTIKNVVHMLSSCMALAVDEGHITANPCRRVRLPKDTLDAHETRFLTPDELRALVDALPDHYKPLVTFMVGTGLRWSEATAIQTRHVNLDAGTVRVEQAWKRVKGGQVLGPPKSPKARRTVNAAVLALAAAAPLLGKPGDYVFTTTTGRPVTYGSFRHRVWVPACDAAGLDPRPGIHALRHTFASWLISEGMSLEAVQDQLGHESILTTRAVYAHLLPAVGVAAGKAASAALARALGHDPQSLGPATLVIEAGGGADQSAHARQAAPDLDDRRDR